MFTLYGQIEALHRKQSDAFQTRPTRLHASMCYLHNLNMKFPTVTNRTGKLPFIRTLHGKRKPTARSAR